MQLSSFSPLNTPPLSNVGSSHSFNSLNTSTVPASPNTAAQSKNTNQDYFNIPMLSAQKSQTKRRSKTELSRGDREWSAKDIQETTDRDVYLSSKSNSIGPFSANRPRNDVQTVHNGNHKRGQRKSRPGQQGGKPEELSKELTKAVSCHISIRWIPQETLTTYRPWSCTVRKSPEEIDATSLPTRSCRSHHFVRKTAHPPPE